MDKELLIVSKDFDILNGIRKEQDMGMLDYIRAKHNDASITFEDVMKSVGITNLGKMQLEKFYNSTDANYNVLQRLLPEVIRDTILNEMNQVSIYNKLIAGSINVGKMKYNITELQDPEVLADGSLADELTNVAEGQEIPASKLTYGDKDVILSKKARALEISYEMEAQSELDLVKTQLTRIGWKLGLQRDKDLVKILINGNKSDKSDGAFALAPVANIDRAAVLKAVLTMQNLGYKPEYMLLNQTTLEALLNVDAFSNPLLFSIDKDGNLPKIMGSTPLMTPTMADGEILFVDPRYSAEQLMFQNFMVEEDKIIRKQLKNTTASVIDGFAGLYPHARVLLKKA